MNAWAKGEEAHNETQQTSVLGESCRLVKTPTHNLFKKKGRKERKKRLLGGTKEHRVWDFFLLSPPSCLQLQKAKEP